MLDHIAEVYQLLNTKYPRGLHWILAGDYNELKIEAILNISPNLKQVLTKHTRMNPPRILDKIITTLAAYYQTPDVLPPLDNDPNKDGKPSDHNIVIMCAISVLNNKPTRETKVITYRPITGAGVVKMDDWFKCTNWDTIFQDKNMDEKAHDMMTLIKEKTDEYFPLKQRKIASDNQLFFTLNLATLKRKKQREYNKNRKSPRWKEMDSKYKIMLGKAKRICYKKEISKIKKSNPRKWY